MVPVVCCATAGVAASQIEQRTIIEEMIFFMPDGPLKERSMKIAMSQRPDALVIAAASRATSAPEQPGTNDSLRDAKRLYLDVYSAKMGPTEV